MGAQACKLTRRITFARRDNVVRKMLQLHQSRARPGAELLRRCFPSPSLPTEILQVYVFPLFYFVIIQQIKEYPEKAVCCSQS